jgi:PAS domain S-box-containing protein
LIIDAKTIERALAHDEIEPCFQPLRELRNGRLYGFELLARWRHPEHGLILPPNFIDVAEQNGLLEELSGRIFRKALSAVAEFSDPLLVTLNISPSQFRYSSLPDQLLTIAAEMSFPLQRLTIEITETAIVHDFEMARQMTSRLKELGCRMLLDDFGTGYSNLRHLQRLKIDGFKIDKSFVSDIIECRESRKIVAAMIGLGQSLGLTTVAEGLESEEQASLLLYLGCDVGQGWYLGRPLPASSIGTVLEAPLPTIKAHWPTSPNQGDLAGLESLPIQRLAHLQAIYDGAPVGLCFLSRDLRYVSVNEKFAEMDGLMPLDMIGSSVEELFPEWYPLYEPYLQRALAGEVLTDIEIARPSSAAGQPVQIFLISYAPAKDERGEVIGISMALLNITERKRSEQDFHAAEERFRAIMNRNPQTPWIFDNQGNLLDFGSQWEKLTGYTRRELLNLGYLDTVFVEDRDRVEEAVLRAMQQKAAIDIEWRVVLKSGGLCWVRSRGTPVFDGNGQVHRYYGSTEDIDELVNLRVSVTDTDRIDRIDSIESSKTRPQAVSSRFGPASKGAHAGDGSIEQNRRRRESLY